MRKRSLLMIPGPIEFDPSVLTALGTPTTSHLAPEFIEIFGSTLEQLRRVVLSEDGQPFILSGSGTLVMDSVGANLIEEGDRALVVNTGYFSDRFAQILERYGAKVTQLRSPIGETPALEEVEKVLESESYKLMTITHVDTSTGVLADIQGLARIANRYGVLVVVDGVCSIAGERFRMTEWGVDVVLTASQKAIGVPPGLGILVVSPRALHVLYQRKFSVRNYFSDWNNWLPIMQSYEARKPNYFATPAVNLIFALKVSLDQILSEGLEERFKRHEAISRACKSGIRALGLNQVPVSDKIAAHTMTAPRYPEGIIAQEFLLEVAHAGVTLAGGLHPLIKNEYFRIGHMGNVQLGDILTTLSAIERSLRVCGMAVKEGISLSVAQASFMQEESQD